MIGHNLNLKKAKATASKKLTMGNFLGNVESNEPTIVGLEPLTDELRKTLNPSDEILYVNHSFDPLRRTMHDSFPSVELFFRINDLGFLPFVMRKLGYQVSPDIDVVNEYTGIIPHSANMLFAENTKTAYVPISTGCSQFCAYCIVPYARGLEKNRDKEEVMKEVEAQVTGGAEEIVLLGQIVNKHPDFDEIVRRTCETPGVKRVRYTSPYPTFYSDELLHLHETMENLCPHIHMPLQSGSNAVLKKMFRGYTAEQFKEFVDKIRALDRPISITSDVIVGFCDETEKDFLETIELVRYAKFDLIYMGIYSPRP
ncbi:MAG: radical SAM protein [bacterium]|nr:radical SAM protein [bacterium]